MNKIERFMATVERKPVDKPASWLGIPVPQAYKGLQEYFEVNSMDEVKKKVNDDLYVVDLPYESPSGNAIYIALDFAKKEENNKSSLEEYERRTLTAKGFFEDYSNPGSINEFDWPDPLKYISVEECKKAVDNVPEGYAVMGAAWSCHYENTCAAFGMKAALIKMIEEPEMVKAVMDRITQFYLDANEIFYSATEGKMHAVLIGNDFGSQNGLILSPSLIKEFVLPNTKKLVEQAKSYGLKVVYHSCGSIYDIIPELIETGVDVIHPIQALAKGMEPQRLKKDFGDKVSFCGGVDAQYLLVHGTPEQIKYKVRELKAIFPTGLVISPSHEAILPDINPANVEALFEAVNER